MKTSDLPSSGSVQAFAPAFNLRLTIFIVAILVSAALLFAVQPMFTKMVLPRLGGAAAVWSVAMVFFQAALLAGYAYAHLLTRYAPGRPSVMIHLAVIVAACFALPLQIASGWDRPPLAGESFWLLELFAVSIGLPFFALSANGPLLQAWFVRTDHPAAKDPYFLYAASNVGSFLALISYPLLVEPFARLGTQTSFWTIGFYVLILLIAACGAVMLRSPTVPFDAPTDAEKAAQPTWRIVLSWLALAAVPSGLLLAVTTHISTDVAAVPLLWVLPLALYLLTFVIAFQTHPLLPHWLVIKVQPIFIVGLVATLVIVPTDKIVNLIAIHLAVFFVCVLMCHGELARRRPAPQNLTAFYMWISAGGMIGGVATGLVAPHVFNWIAEYPLLVVLAVLCRPGLALPPGRSGQSALLGALGIAVLIVIGFTGYVQTLSNNLFSAVIGVMLGLSVQYWRAPLPFAAIIAFVFLSGFYYNENIRSQTVRNFFGVLTIAETSDGRFRVLWHGTVAQGSQRIRDDDGAPVTGRPEMISEFFAGAGIAQVFDAVRARVAGPTSVAVIGLGTGTLACSVRPGDALTYYEIDPDVVRIAQNPEMFNFVSECAPHIPIVIGDARLTLADATDGSYDLIFVDAFLGAAIPIHLLTREAMATYFRKLKPHGIVAMHISNRNLELASVVAGIAEANEAVVRVYDGGDVEEDESQQKWVPRVAAVARNQDDFGALGTSPYWPIRDSDRYQRVWSDDYSNITGAVLRNLRERGPSSDD
ncbi:MAG TPA: fused MFS/spermidine synthase [Pseudolabrys sp.]|nr:fused MFS/spermidine synthase [Pseudolabrys sp.]